MVRLYQRQTQERTYVTSRRSSVGISRCSDRSSYSLWHNKVRADRPHQKINTHLDDKGNHVRRDKSKGQAFCKQNMMSAAKVPGKATEENVIRGNEEAWL